MIDVTSTHGRLREDAEPDKVILAVAKVIKAKFNRGSWLEIALMTGTSEFVQEHPRLLRSLDWGDPDYWANVLDAVPYVLGERGSRAFLDKTEDLFENFGVVEEFTRLPSWLRDNEPQLYAALYGDQPDDTAMDDLEAAAQILGLTDVDEHAARIRLGLHQDPAQAIGSAKELLESVLKAILGLHGNGPETRLDIPELIKRANVDLGLDPAGVRADEPGADQRRRTLGALRQLVTGIAELRNAGHGTGHGLSQRPELDIATARLAVAAAVAAATFYTEAHAARMNARSPRTTAARGRGQRGSSGPTGRRRPPRPGI